jgi:circadian clock protein KaiC
MIQVQHKQLTKVPTNIHGLDVVTKGGLPQGRCTLIAGGPGCGKTVLALQILVNGAKQGEPGIFVAFEEDAARIVINSATFGWDLPDLENKKLFFLDGKPRPDDIWAGDFDLSGMLAVLKAKADQLGAKRIVFDSVDVLLSLLDNPQAERRELFRINDWLVSNEMTGIVTCKNNDSGLSGLDYKDFMQYMVDCVINLTHEMDDRVAHRSLRILKYRGSGFFSGEVTFLLGENGAEIIAFSEDQKDLVASDERISSGVPRLDSMLGGGYYKGSAVLLSGAPGTSKTTLCGMFILAACQRGERSLYVSFDESVNEIVRNLKSVSIDLEPYISNGLLYIESIRSSKAGTEEHIGNLRKLIDTHRPLCLVVDPLSAIVHSEGDSRRRMPEKILTLTKSNGITLLCTSLLGNGGDSLNEETGIEISAVADTWIHISYSIVGGERNRALSIIKSRGSEHSNQVRELIIDSQGITLADVYQANGEVLMGTARWQKEQSELAAEQLLLANVEYKRRVIELAQDEVNAKVKILEVDLAVKEKELKLLLATESLRLGSIDSNRDLLWNKRSGDGDEPSMLREYISAVQERVDE